MRQLDELLDEILQVREERTEEDDHVEETGNGAAANGNGAATVTPPGEATHEPAPDWDTAAETWAETHEEWDVVASTEGYEPGWTEASVATPLETPAAGEQVAEEDTESYAEPQTYAEPEAETNADSQTWAPEVRVEEGPPVEEAMADAWDGAFDAPDDGWEGDATPATRQWEAEAPSAEPRIDPAPETWVPPSPQQWAPPAAQPPADDWTAVQSAAAAPVAPEISSAPEAPPEPAPEIVRETFSDLWTAAPRTESEPEPEPEPEPVSSWIDVSLSTYAPTRGPAGAPVEVPAPVLVPARRRTGRRGSRRERPARRRVLRAVGVAGLVLAVAAASLWTITALRGGPALRPALPAARGTGQQVLVWSVWDERPGGPAFVSVLASGGGFDPVLLSIPPKTVVSVPGRGFESIGTTASIGRPEAVAGAVENILGIRVDAATGMPLASLAPLVDRVGGVEVEDPEDFGVVDPQLNGEQTVEYLRARDAGTGEAGDDIRFIRWLEVTTAIVTKAYERPGLLQEIPEAHRPVFVAAGSGRTEVFDLPVEAIGAGLARPDAGEIPRLVGEHFLTSIQTERVVRIVVINGNGRPGTGQTVARLLVPSGFRLVSSLNARKFNVETTEIVVASEDLLDEAYLAQRLLGVGQVYVVERQSGVADLSIVVGKDFLRR